MTGRSRPALLDLAQQRKAVHVWHVDIGEHDDEFPLDAPRQLIQRLLPRVGEMQNAFALPYLATEVLPEQTSSSSSTAKMLTLIPFPSPPHARVAAIAP